MLKQLSLQARLSLFFSVLLGGAMLASVVAVLVFSQEQLEEEHETAVRLARQFSDSLNRVIQAAPGPHEDIQKLLFSLPTGEAGKLGFLPAGIPATASPVSPRSVDGVPDWFSRLIGAHVVVERFPVSVDGRRLGDIVLLPDLSADIFEKWAAFLALVVTGLLLTALSSTIAYYTVGRTLRPVQELERNLTRLRSGEYGVQMICEGPPEMERSCRELNQLSKTLRGLSMENRQLLRRAVEIQDEERRDLARELHDELGPQLFAIRANATSLYPDDAPAADPKLEKLLEAVEHLQRTNRRILDRLRPMHIQELGLIKSLEGLVRDAASQMPGVTFQTSIKPSIASVDPTAAQTAYRILQETLTNVMRHSGASEVSVSSAVEGGILRIEVSDNGIGFSSDTVVGRGIIGMGERTRALGGSFSFGSRNGKSTIAASIPTTTRDAETAIAESSRN